MSRQLTRDDREALITEVTGPLDAADEAEDVALLADLLSRASTWSEPPADLEERITSTLERVPRRLHMRSRTWRRLVGCAGFAAVFVAVVVFVAARDARPAEAFDAHLGAPRDAHASAFVHITENDAGYRVDFEGEGLRRLDEKRHYYQAWLRNDEGISVPIGTFTSCDDPITMWSGTSPEQFPTITVTLQLIDNQQSPGKIVLTGEVQPA